MSDLMPEPEPAWEPDETAVRASLELLDDAARKVGLYSEQVQMMPSPDVDGDGKPSDLIVVGTFIIGDVAFTPRVQNPAADADHDVVREMGVDYDKSRIEELKQRYKEGRIFDDEHDD